MIPSRPQGRLCEFAGALLLVSACLLLPASSSGGEPLQAPSVMIGGAGGLAVHSGRTVVVDAASGATTRNEARSFIEPAFVGGLLADIGFSSLGRLPGNLGLRLQGDAGAVFRYFAGAGLLRYRLDLPLDGGVLTGVAPWVGFGVALAWLGRPDSEPYVSLPLSLGLDLEVFTPGFHLGLQLDVSMLNPIGPAWSEHDGEGYRQYQSRYNGGALKLIVAYRFQ